MRYNHTSNAEALEHRTYRSINGRKPRRRYIMKQRICGIALIAVGLVVMFGLKEGTASLFCIPLGVILIASRKKIMVFD